MPGISVHVNQRRIDKTAPDLFHHLAAPACIARQTASEIGIFGFAVSDCFRHAKVHQNTVGGALTMALAAQCDHRHPHIQRGQSRITSAVGKRIKSHIKQRITCAVKLLVLCRRDELHSRRINSGRSNLT